MWRDGFASYTTKISAIEVFLTIPAISHLDKVKTWGKQIRVTLSKHQTVQLPKEGQPDAGLTKDYSNSPLHRFKKPGSKNYQVGELGWVGIVNSHWW